MSNSDINTRSWSQYTHDRRPFFPKGPRPRPPSPSLHTSKHSFRNPDATIRSIEPSVSILPILPSGKPTSTPTCAPGSALPFEGRRHHWNEFAAENVLEMSGLRQVSPMTDAFACAPPAPGYLVNTVAPASVRYMSSEEAPHSLYDRISSVLYLV